MNKIKTAIALLALCSALGFIFYYFAAPLAADHQVKKEAAGEDLLKLHERYPDLIGWIQVENTNIDYPVMRGEAYLYKNMEGESDKSGTPFVEEDWTFDDRCTLIYGHNMWMYRTMFNALHKFEKEDFFKENKTIVFYAVCEEAAESAYVEKRTFTATHCILTDVSEWNYGSAQYMTEDTDMSEFLAECDQRALYKENETDLPEKMIMLSTCSYHIKGRDGRTVVVGKLASAEEESIIGSIR